MYIFLDPWDFNMNPSDICPPGGYPPDPSTPPRSRRSSLHTSRKSSWEALVRPLSVQKQPMSASKEDICEEVDLHVRLSACEGSPVDGYSTLDNIAALGFSFNVDDTQMTEGMNRERFSIESAGPDETRSLPVPFGTPRPFNKWVRDIQKRAGQRRKTVSCDVDGSALERELFESPAQVRARHKKSSSGSSYGFVTAVKSATVSLASFSVGPRSRQTGISSRHPRTDRSSKTSNAGRLSEDTARGVIDQAVLNRLLQRRRVIEEIINTEESYIGDVKFLINVSYVRSHLPHYKLSN
jgi:hypothetical protein